MASCVRSRRPLRLRAPRFAIRGSRGHPHSRARFTGFSLHPSNRRAAAAKAHLLKLCRPARCPTRRTANSTRAVHRSLPHLLPRSPCNSANARAKPACPARPATDDAGPRDDVDAGRATTATTRTSTRSARPIGSRRPRLRRRSAASDRRGRGRPRRRYPRAPDHEKFLGARGISHPISVDVDWDADPTERGVGAALAPRARAGLLV